MVSARSPGITARYRSVIHGEFSCIVVSPLGADYYWAKCILKVGPILMKAMETRSTEGFKDIPVTDAPDSPDLDLDDLVVRSRCVRAAADSYL